LKFINWLSRRPNPGVERAATDRMVTWLWLLSATYFSHPPCTRVSALRKSQSYTHPIMASLRRRRWRFPPALRIFFISSINVQVRFPASAWTESPESIRRQGIEIRTISDAADVCAISGLNVFVADRGNDRVVRLNRELSYLAEFRSLEGTSADLSFERPQSRRDQPAGRSLHRRWWK